jgi:hypothetical protein
MIIPCKRDDDAANQACRDSYAFASSRLGDPQNLRNRMKQRRAKMKRPPQGLPCEGRKVGDDLLSRVAVSSAVQA